MAVFSPEKPYANRRDTPTGTPRKAAPKPPVTRRPIILNHKGVKPKVPLPSVVIPGAFPVSTLLTAADNVLPGGRNPAPRLPFVPIVPQTGAYKQSPERKVGLLEVLLGFFQASPASGPQRNAKPTHRKRSLRAHRSRSLYHKKTKTPAPLRHSADPFQARYDKMKEEQEIMDALFRGRMTVLRAAKQGADRILREKAEKERAREAEQRELEAAAVHDSIRLKEIEEEHRQRMKAIALQREEEIRRKAEAEAEALRQHQERMRALQEKWDRERKERERQWAEEAARQEAMREEERRRVLEEAARARAEAAQSDAIVAAFDLYEKRWAMLREEPQNVPTFTYEYVPWPMLSPLYSPESITPQAVEGFIFHPLRANVQGKSRKERIRVEILRWHPDKFNGKVLCHIVEYQRQVVEQMAGTVARILTKMLSDELARERA